MRNRLMAAAALSLALAGCGKSSDTAPAGPANSTAALPKPVAAPGGEDWTQVVSQAPSGGFLMGNPAAKVKLVEYASLTCPHCAVFSGTEFPALRDRYIKTGLVQYELRNYLRDAYDLTATLLSRCGGAQPYFKLSEQLWASQPQWEGKAYALPADQMAQLKAASPEQIRPLIAKFTGLDTFIAQRGIAPEKVQACLNDKAAIDSLDKLQTQATNDQVQGTPSFLINGTLQRDVFTFEQLEPLLKGALAA